jgi:hypothetical protein
VETLGQRWAAHVTAANAQDRSQGRTGAERVQEVTGDAVEGAFVAQGYTGEHAAAEAQAPPPAGGEQAAGGDNRLCAATPVGSRAE